MSRQADAPDKLASAWTGLQARERRLVALAAAVIGLALLWWLGLSPALATLRAAPAQRAALQAQAQQMQRLQREAEALQALPRLGRDEALRALESAARQRLGATGQLSVVGDRANVALKATPAQDLADWLADARANARAAPVEARLTRAGDRAPGAPVLWSGTLSLGLPP
ncbi:type II secretion system protein GspM [Ottowia sp.]|jgi:general secretion pathway protein M|uniref:type II secretion system protein GspM n=1 Tax=Ottowia sp. TaxID=1898956 RepID=UPI0025CFC728|nr:type II secretion system protein GspM [Ottowia sp.]MBK6614201.1 type II secretion system protein M [Ottowia sp.]MBK6745240.1 type II secretion system protein M [Ottowia sp.]